MLTVEQVVSIDKAIAQLQGAIKSNYRLAFRLAKVQQRIKADVDNFQKTREKLIQDLGTQQVTFRCSPEDLPEGAVANGYEKQYTLPVPAFEAVTDKSKLEELNRDTYKFTSDGQKQFNDTITAIAAESACEVTPLPISLFEGVEHEGLGSLINALAPILTDEE